MSAPLIVTVTKNDVDKAQKKLMEEGGLWRTACECPISQATRKQVKNKVITGAYRVVVAKRGHEREYLVDDMAKVIITLFDTGQIDRLKALLPVTLRLGRI